MWVLIKLILVCYPVGCLREKGYQYFWYGEWLKDNQRKDRSWENNHQGCWWLRNQRLFQKKKCMKRATWADCDSSHQNIWVGTLFWVSRRLHEKLKPRCWKFLSVTREGTGLRGLLWRKAEPGWCHRALGGGCASLPLGGARLPCRWVHYLRRGVWKPVQLLNPTIVQQPFGAWPVSEDRIWTTRTFSFGKYVYEDNWDPCSPES